MFPSCSDTLERITSSTEAAPVKPSKSASRGRAWRPAAVATALVITLASGRAAADAPPPESKNDVSAWKVDDSDPEKSIPSEKDRNRDPIQFGYWLMDVTARAAGAAKRGDHRAAIRYYTALAKAVPDRSIAFSKMCDEYVAVDEHVNAVATCGLALFRDGVTAKDYVHYMNLILSAPGKLDEKETSALATVIAHLREDPKQAALADELECETGVRTGNADQLAECTKGMAARSPDEPKTLVYEWNLAMQRHQYDAARQLLERAKTTQMKPEAIAQMETETGETVEQCARMTWLGIGTLLTLGAGGLVTAFALRRRRAVEPHPA